ncbi:MAG TPA: hypothetical protein VHZ26_09600 [Caulobacteraceae bacterium]|jgi:hypothetical protein|nr:hypothetical protein [Caulobacteraceae bacterium]
MERTKTPAVTRAAMLLAAAGALALPIAARADSRTAFIQSLDAPSSTRTVKPKSDADPVGEIVCTYYPDLMVRETGTDTPDPAAATLVPLKPGAARPACNSKPIAGAIALKTGGAAFDGRKGGFLIFDDADPNGAEPFTVLDARTGRILFQDATYPVLGLKRTAGLERGTLTLAYTRGYNAGCSMMQAAKACWARLVAAGNAPAALPPVTQAPRDCIAAYKDVGAADPSVIGYAVTVTLDAAGKARATPHGAVMCMPQP